MKAIILAAGRGSRMQHLTLDRPKCLLEVRGRSLLDWQRQALAMAGVTDVALVTGYRREQLAGLGLTEFHNPRWAETSMVTSLACAASWLQATPCVVSYSDIFYDADAVVSLMNCPADLAVLYDTNWRQLWERRFGNPLRDAETFRLNSDGTLAEIGNPPATVEEVEGQYMGLLRFTPGSWREVERIRSHMPAQMRDAMHMTGTLQKMVEAGRVPIAAIPYQGAWGEVDHLEDLALYHAADRQTLPGSLP